MPMSMFVVIDATIKVKIELLADSVADGLATASAVLPQCRLLKPSFWHRGWLERLLDISVPWDAVPVTEVVDAEVVSSSYAGGE